MPASLRSALMSALIAAVIYVVIATAISLIFYQRLSWDGTLELVIGLFTIAVTFVLTLVIGAVRGGSPRLS